MQAYLGATAITGDGRTAIADSVVLVEHGRILAVGDGRTPVPAEAETVDLRGRFLLPGLTEGHAHISGFASEAYHPDAEGPFRNASTLMDDLLRWGVTMVRDTGGPDLASTQLLQRHGRAWPRFFGSGPNLDGHPGGPWKGIWKTDVPKEVADFVEMEADAGMDFIKCYAWMNEDVLATAIREAHRFGLRVAGHVGYRVTAERAVQLGIDALEHIRIGVEVVPANRMAEYRALPFRPRDELGSMTAWRFVELDSPEVEGMINLLVERGTYVTPTLAIFQSHLDPHAEGDESLHHDDSTTGEAQYDPAETEIAQFQFDQISAFVGMAREAGVKIVAGSDTPSPQLAPGPAAHTELELLVQAGLTPLQAIEAATATAAELLGRSHDLGGLRGGNHADLLVLTENPLADIRNTRSIDRVVLGGDLVWQREQSALVG